MAKTRTFIAIDIADAVRSSVVKLMKELDHNGGDTRWADAESLHYTLHFLGDLTDQELAEVCTQVARVAAAYEPFRLESGGVGAFPSFDRPRALWVGAGRGAERLIAIRQATDEALTRLGYRGENRPYVPHLTIAKSGRTGRDGFVAVASRLSASAGFTAGETSVEELVVFASNPRGTGPLYTPLARCPLRRSPEDS